MNRVLLDMMHNVLTILTFLTTNGEHRGHFSRADVYILPNIRECLDLCQCAECFFYYITIGSRLREQTFESIHCLSNLDRARLLTGNRKNCQSLKMKTYICG